MDATVAINVSNSELPDNDFNEFCIICDKEKTYGYIVADFVFDDENEKFDGPSDGRCGDYCTPISPDQIVPGVMPLLELVPLLKHHPFFFVLTRNVITHTVGFRDLDKLPVKLCLFALLMALEAELIRVFQEEDPQGYLDLLPEGRLKKAQELYELKYKGKLKTVPPQEQARLTLLCTTFIDKATMLVRSSRLFTALPFVSKSEADQFFTRAQDLRNQIAHSDSILRVVPSAGELDGFVNNLKKITEALSNLRDRSS